MKRTVTLFAFIFLYNLIAFSQTKTFTTTNQTSCGPDTLILSANGAKTGEIYKWYSKAIGGTVLFADTVKTSTFTSNFKVYLNKTDTFYVAIDSAGFLSSRVAVVGTILPLPINVKQALISIVPFSGLVAYFPFNGNANDSSSNKLNGTIHGNVVPTTDRYGDPNSAYYFAGTSNGSDWIEVAHNSLLNIGPSFTVSQWVYKETGSSNNSLSKGRDISSGTWSLFAGAIGINGSGGYQAANPTPLNLNQWYMVTGVLDGNTGKLKYYQDGKFISEVNASSFVASNSFPVAIGRHVTFLPVGNSWPYPFKGKIDDIGIWNRALSAQEIKALYNGGNAPVVSVYSDTICSNQPDTLTIFNSQLGVRYQLFKDSVLYGSSKLGNDSIIKFPLSNLSSPTHFQIFATDTSSACGLWLDTNLFVQVNCCIDNVVPSLGSLDTGMVAYYPFNGNANDESGNGNNGTVNGATLTTDRFGNANRAYNFDGVNDYIEVANSSSLQNINDQITISAWGYGAVYFLCKSGWGNMDMHFRLLSYALYCYGKEASFTQAIPVNEWYLLTATYDKTTFKFYINGVFIYSSTGGNVYTYLTSSNMYIGVDPHGGIEYSTGKIDDIRIYNRALTPSEIKTLYNEGKTLSVSVLNDTICTKQADTLSIFNSQTGVKYQLYKDSVAYGSALMGNDSTIKFPLSNLTSPTHFQIYATDTSSACGLWLDTNLFIQVNCCIDNVVPILGSLDTGMVAYYPFNGNANDESGNGNNGTVNGATLTADRFGKLNSAYILNGSNNWIELSNPIPDMTELTFQAWTYFTGNNNGVIFMDATTAVSNDFVFDMTKTRIGIRADKTGAILQHEYPDSTFRGLNLNNSWHNLIWVMKSNKSDIYIDGKLLFSVLESANNIGYHASHPSLGCWWDEGTRQHYFTGKLDDIRIYNRALTPSEIKALYNEVKTLKLSLANDSLCNNDSTQISILNAQAGVAYSLVKASDSSQVGATKYGKSDTLIFSTGKVPNTTGFLINARDTSSNCSIYLDTIITVNVKPYPITAFSTVDSFQCFKGNSFAFINNTTIAAPNTFSNFWSFGDANSSVNSAPSHSYSAVGTYQVKLVATSNFGCKDSFVKTLHVYPQPLSAFNVKDSSQCLSSNLFNFNNTTAGAKGYFWNFGDLATDTATKPVHQYSTPGTFVVKLVATSQFGCKDSVSKSMMVMASPKAGFAANDTLQCISGNLFSFTNSTIGAVSQIWDFGDGNRDTASNTSYSYALSGTYFVKLLAKNTIGCTDSLIQKIEVSALPIAAFSVNSKKQYLPGNNFIFSSAATVPKSNVNFSWDFGDGNTSIAANPTHSYAAVSAYKVTFIASSVGSCADTISDSVFVMLDPGITVSFSLKNACVGDTVLFKNTSTVNPPDSFLNFFWDFGDGNQTIVKDDPRHFYSSAGTYYITLAVLTAFGSKDTLIDTLEVYPSPTVNITAMPDTIAIQGRPITLTANGTYDQLLWWDNSNLQTVNVLTEGKYWVTATFNNGCKSSDTIELTKGDSKGFEIVNGISPNGDGINEMLVIKNIDLIKPCKLSIFNRWGDELYSSKDYQNNWNGTYKGKTLPEGSYYYLIETRDGKIYKGAVNIMK